MELIKKPKFTYLRIEPYSVPVAELGEENPLPIFKEDSDKKVICTDAVPEEDRKYLGWKIGYRVLPYKLQENYNRKLTQKMFNAVILENNFLKATFLPQMGGRLVSLFHKPKKKELTDSNPVIQFCPWSVRKAWWSSGIEFNLPLHGHGLYTSSPIFAARILGTEGEPAVRFYEWERCLNLIWQFDFYLPPDSEFLFMKTKIINTNSYEIPFYYWTCMAVPELPGSRVLASADFGIYHDHRARAGEHMYDFSEVPKLPQNNYKDISYTVNSTCCNSIFFRVPDRRRAWITSLDKNGFGLIETSTPHLKGRKVYMWGNHQGGRNWQNHLTIYDDKREEDYSGYVEIQAGLARTQEECVPMPSDSEFSWTEVFGSMEIDPKKVHCPDWKTACKNVQEALSKKISEKEVEEWDEKFSKTANLKPIEILSNASGWGALEQLRIKINKGENKIPDSVLFPESSIGPEQKKWTNLIKNGYLAVSNPKENPGEYMIQEHWQKYLEKSIKNKKGNNWYALLHLGTIYMENGDYDKAKKTWESSIDKCPSCWAYRNLSVLERREGNINSSLSYMLKAFEIAFNQKIFQINLFIECLELLCATKQFKKALQIFNKLPRNIQENEKVMICRLFIAKDAEDWGTVERILGYDFQHIENEEDQDRFINIWNEMWEKRLAKQLGKEVDNEICQMVRNKYPIPPAIDLRWRPLPEKSYSETWKKGITNY